MMKGAWCLVRIRDYLCISVAGSSTPSLATDATRMKHG
jgi:hypothetical protein